MDRPNPGAQGALRAGVGPAALVAVVCIVTWLVSGVGVLDIIRFLGYELAFVALPGIALLWALRGRRSGVLVTIALGWTLGQTLEILAFSATAAAGTRGLFLPYPLVVIAGSALAIWLRRDRVEGDESPDPVLTGRLMWFAAGALSLALIYLALLFLPQVPLPSQVASVAWPIDYPYFIGLIGQVMNHWPPTSPGLVGVPLHYEWFVLFHMAAITQVTHAPIDVVALRLDYVPTIVVVGCQLLAVGRFIARSAWTGVIAIMVVFLLGALDLTTDAGSAAPFSERFNVHLIASWTFPFGLMFLLALLYVITERLQAPRWDIRRDFGPWALMALLMVGASGAKATILPVIITGTGLYALVLLVVRRALPQRALVIVALSVVVFAITFVAVYGGGVPGTVIQPFTSLAGTFPAVQASHLSSHPTLREVLQPFAYLAGIAGLMLPLAGMLYLLRRRHRSQIPRYLLCICLFLAGLVIANLVHQISYSEQYFLDTGYVAGSIVAAAGLRLAWLDARQELSLPGRALIVAFLGWAAVLIIAGVITSRAMVHRDALIVRYSGLAIGCALFVGLWWLALKTRRRPTSGIAALALIPFLAASALTSPIVLSPTVKRIVSGEPVAVTQADPKTVWGMTQATLAALEWLKDHTSVDTVFAVSNHWTLPNKTDARYYYYTAFAERQVFIEAYDPIRFGITTGLATPAGVNFAFRERVNDAVFLHASVASLNIMTRDYSVRFLFIDRLHGDPVDPVVVQLGHVVYSSSAAYILAVG